VYRGFGRASKVAKTLFQDNLLFGLGSNQVPRRNTSVKRNCYTILLDTQ